MFIWSITELRKARQRCEPPSIIHTTGMFHVYGDVIRRQRGPTYRYLEPLYLALVRDLPRICVGCGLPAASRHGIMCSPLPEVRDWAKVTVTFEKKNFPLLLRVRDLTWAKPTSVLFDLLPMGPPRPDLSPVFWNHYCSCPAP